jgi:hypothetical protein
MRPAFRFRLIPFIATVLLVALGIALGNWQERRAAQKIAIGQRLAARTADAPLVLGPAITPVEPMDSGACRSPDSFCRTGQSSSTTAHTRAVPVLSCSCRLK